ncbi:unnamed protein product [Lathyrus oleraceus]|uniref:Uncharacterized protein n=1 Tax=Pisum sativum TaxID=3888 RepID=A0A9D5AWZ6_PEA|nr:uncharacterized protein LOC127076203 [Pisum sativum]KAI5422256.1 hypothetical protein KIW84_045641 [Pisum sativum]
MALHCNSLAQIPIQKYDHSFVKYSNNLLISKRCYAPRKKSSVGQVVFKITASIKNKVYEDESQGIVCYQDESGEIICEGCDEGPSYRQISRPIQQTRDIEIVNLLKQSWFQIAKGGEEIDDAVEGFNLKFNKRV